MNELKSQGYNLHSMGTQMKYERYPLYTDSWNDQLEFSVCAGSDAAWRISAAEFNSLLLINLVGSN
jgi:hypothetical protein